MDEEVHHQQVCNRLDAISDWPWIALGDLAGLLGVSPQRASQLVNPLEGFGLAARPLDAGGRLVVADRGLALLARRDRTSVGLARKRWSVAQRDADAPMEWRNVSGSRRRQILRNMEHTDAVHGFLGTLTAQVLHVNGTHQPVTVLRRKPNQRQRAWWKAIHRAKLQGTSNRAIAKNLGISRNTVKKYLAAGCPEMVGAVVTPRIRRSVTMANYTNGQNR